MVSMVPNGVLVLAIIAIGVTGVFFALLVIAVFESLILELGEYTSVGKMIKSWLKTKAKTKGGN